jgi:hypothetical protein
MKGKKMLLRYNCKNISLTKNVHTVPDTKDDLNEFIPYIKEFCKYFGYDENEIIGANFTIVTPNSNNPYKQMYVQN